MRKLSRVVGLLSLFWLGSADIQPAAAQVQGTQAVIKAAQAVAKSFSGAGPRASKISSALKRNFRRVKDFVGGTGAAATKTTTNQLQPPKDYCPLTRGVAKDLYDRLDEAFGPDATTAQYSLPCNSLPEFWEGKGISRWSVYTMGNSTLPSQTRRTELVVEMTKTTQRSKLADLAKLAKRSPTSEEYGLVDATPDAVYIASLGPDDNGKPVAHVAGITIVGSRVTGFNLYADLKDAKVFDELLATAKDVVARSIEASGEK